MTRYSRAQLVTVLSLLAVTGFLSVSLDARAAVPQTIGYQGYLADAAGAPVNGSVSMIFSLYSAPSGIAAPLWSETHGAVQVTNGVYSVILGSVTPLGLPFDVQYWLGVQVGADQEMTPRTALTSAGYALRSVLADGVSDAAVTGAMIAPGAVTMEKLSLACSVGDTLTQTASGWVCTPLCTPSAEMCDGRDNNCDGAVDEGWLNNGKYDRDDACGNCITDCTVIYAKPNASGFCDASGTPVCSMTCDAGSYDLNGVPLDGCEFLADPAAIYVSASDPSAANDAMCGLSPSATGGHPCLTIAYGIQRAQSLGRTKVLVADGLYAETVTLANGISLFGGYRPDTWERHVSSTLSLIRGAGGSLHKKTLIADSITVATTVEGFVIEGQTNFTAGGNSYAVWIRNSSDVLSIVNNTILGGAGGSGSGVSNGLEGQDGVAGSAGQNSIELATFTLASCTSNPQLPGVPGGGGSRICGVMNVSGGNGGGASCPNNNEQKPNGASGAGNGAGAGGAGGFDRSSSNCATFNTGGLSAAGISGSNGAKGSHGAAGAGCAAGMGSVVSGEWVGSSAASGASGVSGSGGGGGGAGGGADVTIDCSGTPDDTTGGSGGGGGSGGCSGSGGGGGGAGGGAFAVFVTFTSPAPVFPTIAGNSIRRGNGGIGGNGGAGGDGGIGGAGGAGGIPTGRWLFAMGAGGRGGDGGDGGAGGGGGGGCGGVSYGVYIHNITATPPYKSVNIFLAGGAGGSGGAGGPSYANGGAAGAAGVSAEANY